MSETVMVDGAAVEYGRLPEFCREIVRRYLEAGIDPGYGWRLILASDLEAVVACDADTVACLPDIYKWLHNHMPSRAWRSDEKVRVWMRARRAR